MTDLTKWVNDLYDDVQWQRIPTPMSEGDQRLLLSKCLEKGLEAMFIQTGRAMQYEDSWLVYDGDGILSATTQDLRIDELRYAYLTAKIEFFKQVQTDVNNIVGYTTDALTVTNADKPYQNLQQTIGGLEEELRKVYYTMIRYVYL